MDFSAPEPSLDCPTGCLSIWCMACRDHQNRVIRAVSTIIGQIDEVEALFPSTQNMVKLYPAWGDPEFVARCNTLYLWYNNIVELRQTITLLGNRLQHIASCSIPWPTFIPIVSPMASVNTDDLIGARRRSSAATTEGLTAPTSPVKFIIGGDDCDEEEGYDELDMDLSERSTVPVESDSATATAHPSFKSTNAHHVNISSVASSVSGSSNSELRDLASSSDARGSNDRDCSSGDANLLSPVQQIDEVPLKRCSSTNFLEVNPYRSVSESFCFCGWKW